MDLTQSQIEKIEKLKVKDCHYIIIIDGSFNSQMSTKGPGGISVSLDSNFEVNTQEDALDSLTHANLNEVVTLTVEKDKKTEKPIQVIYFNSVSVNSSVRLNVVVSAGSSAEILETFFSETEAISLSRTNVTLAKNAQLNHYKIQKFDLGSKFISKTQVLVDSDADYTGFILAEGASTSRDAHEILFNGIQSRARVFCSYIGFKDQHLDQQSLIEHFKGENTSLQFYKGILGDNAKGVFNGIVRIHPDAQKASSEQTNKNLLLSEKAEINSKPHLEIFADDVKAAHGSTVGQLSPEEVFYLQSRGISKTLSEQLLTEGFVLDILNEISNPHIKSEFTHEIRRKLSQT